MNIIIELSDRTPNKGVRYEVRSDLIAAGQIMKIQFCSFENATVTKMNIEFVRYKETGFWQHFLRATTEEGTLARCVFQRDGGACCGSILKMGKRKSTGTLTRHLRTVHQVEGDEDESSAKKQCRDSIEKVISRLVAKDGFTLRVLTTSTTIRKWALLDGYALPDSPTTIRAKIWLFYMQIKEEYIELFRIYKRNGLKFAITFDEWTSLRKRRYGNLNIHVDGKTFCLGLIRCNGSMPAEKCASLITDKLKEYQLEATDIVGVTTDGAKVMEKMGRQLVYSHQLCMAHGLHLAVSDVLYSIEPLSVRDLCGDSNQEDEDDDEFDGLVEDPNIVPPRLTDKFGLKDLIKKVGETVKLFSHSAVRNDVLQAYVKAVHKEEIKLLGECKTRWNSTLAMIRRFLKLRLSVNQAIAELEISMPSQVKLVPFTELQIESLNKVASALEQVEITLTKLCTRNTNLLEMDTALALLIERTPTTSLFSKALRNALIKRISERRGIASCALQYLLNGYTNKLPECFKKSSREEIEAYILAVYKRWTTTVDPERADDIILGDDEEPEEPDDFAKALQQRLESQSKESEKNIPKPLGIHEELLNFYLTKIRGPILEAIFKNLKSIQVTSVESERSFSAAGRTCSKYRTRLDDTTLDAILFLMFYFKNPC